MLIHQLIYISRAVPGITSEDLFDILNKSQAKNSKLGISGVLVFHKGAFIQLLEGGEVNVKELFATICEDVRHTNVEKVFEADVDKRLMPTWFMGFSASEVDSVERFVGQSFYISFDVTRQICALIEGEVGQIFRKFLDA